MNALRACARIVGASEDPAAARKQDPVVEVAEQNRLLAKAEQAMQRFDQSRDRTIARISIAIANARPA